MEITIRAATNVITHFVGLLTLRNKPQNLVYSMNVFALLFLLLAFSIKITAQNSIPQVAAINSFIPILIITYEVLFLTIVFLMLTKAGKKNRFIQVGCNFLGVNIINCLISSLVLLVPFQMFFLCLTKSWLLIINFHITKHAFNIDQIRAVWTYLLINGIALLAITMPFIIFTTLHNIK